jgi:hypothetical protein
MRKLLMVSLGTLVGGTTLVVVLATYCATRHQQAVSVPADLPDLITWDSEEEKRSFLIEGARRDLESITRKHDKSLLARANCEVVESRLEQDYGNANAAPMMIASSLVPLADDKQCFFFVWCFNPHREDDAIFLVGRTAEGTIVRVRYESDPRVKRGALVGTCGGKTTLVSLDELFQAGKVLRNNGDIEVRILVQTKRAPVVPDLPVLAVAVRDRNGKLSNFVSVCRGKPVNREKGIVETVEEGAGNRRNGHTSDH